MFVCLLPSLPCIVLVLIVRTSIKQHPCLGNSCSCCYFRDYSHCLGMLKTRFWLWYELKSSWSSFTDAVHWQSAAWKAALCCIHPRRNEVKGCCWSVGVGEKICSHKNADSLQHAHASYLVGHLQKAIILWTLSILWIFLHHHPETNKLHQ